MSKIPSLNYEKVIHVPTGSFMRRDSHSTPLLSLLISRFNTGATRVVDESYILTEITPFRLTIHPL